MKAHINQCRSCVREVVSMTADCKDKYLLKPNLNKKARLRGMGIDTHMAMTNFKIAITEAAKTAIAKEVLRSQRRRIPKQICDIMEGRRPIDCAKYKDTGRTAWLRSIKPFQGQIFRQSTSLSEDGTGQS